MRQKDADCIPRGKWTVLLDEEKVWCSFDLQLERCFKKLGDGGVAGDAILIREHIMTLILENQIVHLLSGSLKLLDHISRLALDDTRIVLTLNH